MGPPGRGTSVTAAEWLACTDPEALWEPIRAMASERKLHLFRVACCCAIRGRLAPNARAAVNAAERYADGRSSRLELVAAYARVQEDYVAFLRGHPETDWDRGELGEYWPLATAKQVASPSEQPRALADEVWNVARYVWSEDGRGRHIADRHRPRVRNVLLCLFGSPFRGALAIDPVCRAWNDGTILKLARDIYARLVLGRLPVLADALEDAGCADAELLGHLRGPGPHVRGCWAVDLVLGKV